MGSAFEIHAGFVGHPALQLLAGQVIAFAVLDEHSASFDEAEGDISLYTFLPQSGGRHSRTRWGRLVSRKNTTSLR